MIDLEIGKIARSLESERDWYKQNSDSSKLNEVIMLEQLNIFYTTFALSLSNNTQNTAGIEGSYQGFFNARFDAVRYLIELFLTSVQIGTQESEVLELKLSYALAVSDKIRFFQMDQRIFLIDPIKVAHQKAIDNDIIQYRDFLKRYSKIDPRIPDDLAEYERYAQNPGGIKFEEKFGFHFYPHGKLDFSEIFNKNAEIDNLFDRLHEEEIFNKDTTKRMLRDLYTVYSSVLHPTITSVETFEIFIGASPQNKEGMTKNQKKNNLIVLKAIAILMDSFFKRRRSESITRTLYAI